MKTILPIILFIICPAFLFSQKKYNLLDENKYVLLPNIKEVNAVTGNKIIQDIDGKLVVVGKTDDEKLFISFSKKGDFEILKNDEKSEAYSVLQAYDGNYIVVGYKETNGKKNGLILKYDFFRKTLLKGWPREFEEVDRFTTLQQLKSGQIISIGYRGNSVNFFDVEKGKRVNEPINIGGMIEEVNGSLLINDNEILVYGSYNDGNKKRAFLIKYNVKINHFDPPIFFNDYDVESIKDLKRLSNIKQELLLVGTVVREEKDIIIADLNYDYKVQLRGYIRGEENEVGEAVVQALDGSLYIVGFTDSWSSYDKLMSCQIGDGVGDMKLIDKCAIVGGISKDGDRAKNAILKHSGEWMAVAGKIKTGKNNDFILEQNIKDANYEQPKTDGLNMFPLGVFDHGGDAILNLDENGAYLVEVVNNSISSVPSVRINVNQLEGPGIGLPSQVEIGVLRPFERKVVGIPLRLKSVADKNTVELKLELEGSHSNAIRKDVSFETSTFGSPQISEPVFNPYEKPLKWNEPFKISIEIENTTNIPLDGLEANLNYFVNDITKIGDSESQIYGSPLRPRDPPHKFAFNLELKNPDYGQEIINEDVIFNFNLKHEIDDKGITKTFIKPAPSKIHFIGIGFENHGQYTKVRSDLLEINKVFESKELPSVLMSDACNYDLRGCKDILNENTFINHLETYAKRPEINPNDILVVYIQAGCEIDKNNNQFFLRIPIQDSDSEEFDEVALRQVARALLTKHKNKIVFLLDLISYDYSDEPLTDYLKNTFRDYQNTHFILSSKNLTKAQNSRRFIDYGSNFVKALADFRYTNIECQKPNSLECLYMHIERKLPAISIEKQRDAQEPAIFPENSNNFLILPSNN